MEPDSDFEVNWGTQLRKGTLELCLLNAVNARRLYGYELVRRLSAIDSLVISEGTVYPILSRLKREGFVKSSIEESPDGPARKYYQLTEKGRRQLQRMNAYWKRLHDGVQALEQGS
jgi:PadR family transcriptional regulator PadR